MEVALIICLLFSQSHQTTLSGAFVRPGSRMPRRVARADLGSGRLQVDPVHGRETAEGPLFGTYFHSPRKWAATLKRDRDFLLPDTDFVRSALLSMGFSRQEHWSGLPFPSPGDLPDPGMERKSPALQADALPSEPPGRPPEGSRVLASNGCVHSVSQKSTQDRFFR